MTRIVTVLVCSFVLVSHCAYAQEVVQVDVSTDNTVFLESSGAKDLRPELIPGTVYQIHASVSGNAGGVAQALFFWQGGYTDANDIHHSAEYFVVPNGYPYEYYYPASSGGSGPSLFAFFADRVGATDNSVQADLEFVPLASVAPGGTNNDYQTAPAAGTQLGQNYPNPFNPSTTIEYTVDSPASVRLNIYNPAGQLVNTIDQGQQTPGEYQVQWSGDDAGGQTVASGTYFYQLEVSGHREAKKMVLVK